MGFETSVSSRQNQSFSNAYSVKHGKTKMLNSANRKGGKRDHSMCFSSACLTVSKYRDIIPIKCRLNKWLNVLKEVTCINCRKSDSQIFKILFCHWIYQVFCFFFSSEIKLHVLINTLSIYKVERANLQCKV